MTTEALTVYRDALAALDGAIAAIQRELSMAAAARPIDLDTLTALLEPVVRTGNDVRRALSGLARAANEPVPEWADRSELELASSALVRRAEERATNRWRERLESVAETLRAGKVVNHFTGRVSTRLDELRSQAAAEVAEVAKGAEALDLPGPSEGSWLTWVWGQPGGELETILDPVRMRIPTLFEFLLDVDPKNWMASPAAPCTSPHPTPPPTPPPTDLALGVAPEPPGAFQTTDRPSSVKSSVVQAAPAPAAPSPVPAPSARVSPVAAPAPAATARPGRGISVTDLNKARMLTSWLQAPTRTTRSAGEATKHALSVHPEVPTEDGPARPGAEASSSPPASPLSENEGLDRAEPLSPSRDESPAPPILVSVIEETPEAKNRPVTVGTADRKPEPAPMTGSQPVQVSLASAEEIVIAYRTGDFLRAALLTLGREAVGLTDLDPTGQVALVAHHVLSGSAAAPWPDWCLDEAAAREIADARPNSARFIYLAAQCQAATDGVDPLSAGAAGALLEAFNTLAQVRQWLDVLHEVRGVPGLLEHIRTLTPLHDAAAEFRAHRAAFLEHTNRANQLRNRAAYHHRQDQYLSKLPAGVKLLKFLQPTAPPNAVRDPHPDIDEFLAQTPEAIINGWLASMDGAIVLNGNQRTTLRKQAEEYIRLAARAWQAARTFVRRGVHTSEVERFRNRLADFLPSARSRAAGQLWVPLFERLAEGVRK